MSYRCQKRVPGSHQIPFSFRICLFILVLIGAGCQISCSNRSSPGTTAPTISTQPANQSVSVGQAATFSVVASGNPSPTYQWQKNGNSIGGATSSSYTTPATVAADNGATFRVVVSNSAGSVTSNAASLTVNNGGGGGPNVSVLTYHNDVGRTGQNLNETILTTANVNSTNFGKVGFLAVQGLVDAEPLYVPNLSISGVTHNVVFVVTEHDLVYAFDADTFAKLWQVSVLGTNETTSDDHNCSQITPEIGITATPVIDLKAGAHGTIFLAAMSKDSSNNYYQRLHALDLTTGAEQSGSPTTIQATFPNSSASGQTTFDPGPYAERSGLLLLNGVIYMGWTSHCDQAPYRGWIMGYSESTLQQVSVINVTPNGSEGSIWMAGAGLAADSSNFIYFLDANGTFDATLNANGFPSSGDYGNAFVKLSTAGGGLSVADYFTMYNTVSESDSDEDLGSGGALVLPDMKDASGNTMHLAVGAGKDANIYVVNRDSMGRFNPNNDNAIYQEIDGALGGGVWSMPAYFNGTIYYGGVSDLLKAFPITNARLAGTPSSMSNANYPYPGATPSISASGSSNGIVWAVQNAGTGVLHAYDATNLANELYNSNQAGSRDQFTDNKFITPMIANGKVYVGTPTGVMVFGLLQ
jgi:Immunoglobulin domain